MNPTQTELRDAHLIALIYQEQGEDYDTAFYRELAIMVLQREPNKN